MIVQDPKEQSAIRLIETYWQCGMGQRAIARKLNGQKIRPRRAKAWSQTLVASVIQRLSAIKKK
jgi:hypothetical protein